MIAWALILILAGNILGGESSIELSQIRDITHAPEAVDQPSISQHHSNQVGSTSLPDLTPSNGAGTLTLLARGFEQHEFVEKVLKNYREAMKQLLLSSSNNSTHAASSSSL
ncbi:uncharacterized protein PGTG_05579 [Puccinia graminis f. sp. tritici CRL 75-36-700-3]|uniref:Uncharacterized protein n=1 Tax=Puccinia graminis f. sp. tritici (strain CRL 75-36-700-3 / race SCCL) TaxID=418459 RepID=E3K4U3_PUCGT|nr:uncharacterized protein PGTG_05579 [Puccinia graminis f. sp. tritici CRL 75-36-700-3]EFP79258.1 hypothetical protein PGTG_05579 [Puccinia graminis f. sp. tritici CRL 75-36-700-3]